MTTKEEAEKLAAQLSEQGYIVQGIVPASNLIDPAGYAPDDQLVNVRTSTGEILVQSADELKGIVKKGGD